MTSAIRMCAALAAPVLIVNTLALAGEKIAQKPHPARTAEEDSKIFALADLMRQGERVYIDHCVHCHQGTGRGRQANTHYAGPGVPALAGSKVANGGKEAHIDVVLNGRPQTAMQPFKHLSNVALAAVITYTRNSWGNKAGEVQPVEVKARRKGK
jgi:cytochrome c oxidase subunit II